MNDYIYVVSKDGTPLMPSKRWRKIKILLKEKKAVVLDTKPFIVKLLYDTKSKEIQNLTIGIDPGRTNIGVSVVKDNGIQVFSANVETRNKDIPKLMSERKSHRQQSRRGERLRRQRRAIKNKTTFKDSRKGKNNNEENTRLRFLPHYEKPITLHYIKNTEAKFFNRKRDIGWLTPTANHLLQTHINLVKKLQKFLPINKCAIELNKFDFAKMDNPLIKKWEYQKGILHDTTLHEAINDMQKCRCLLCRNKIEHYHHIVERSKDGSNTIHNLCGLCESCHTEVHKNEKLHQKLLSLHQGCLKKYNALSVLNQIMPKLLIELEKIFNDNLNFCFGYETKETRNKYNISKDHKYDAYAIILTILDKQLLKVNEVKIENIIYDNFNFIIKQFRRHNRQIIHSQTERTYKLDSKVVAKNRHKRMGQTTDSLHEWYIKTKHKLGRKSTRQLQSKLKVIKSTKHYRDINKHLIGSIFFHKGKRKVISGTLTNGNYYRTIGDTKTNYSAKKVIIKKNNSGLVFI